MVLEVMYIPHHMGLVVINQNRLHMVGPIRITMVLITAVVIMVSQIPVHIMAVAMVTHKLLILECLHPKCKVYKISNIVLKVF